MRLADGGLLPVLSGKAQTAVLGLPESFRRRYQDIRKAVLDRMGYSPKDHRHRFQSTKLGPADFPFIYTQQLKDAVIRWRQPGESAGKGQMLEQVVLEQFMEGLPAGTSEWVRYHRPKDLAALTVHPGTTYPPGLHPSSLTFPLLSRCYGHCS